MSAAILFGTGILLGSIGAVLMKRGAIELPPFSLGFDYALAFAGNVYIVAGFFFYFVPALIWTYLLSIYPVSLVQPILSLTYVLTPILAFLFLGEHVPSQRWAGIFCIILGVVLVSRSG